MPVSSPQPFAYSGTVSSLFPSCFPSSDADSHVVSLSDELHAAESLQPFHIDCPLTRLPLCHCPVGDGSSLWASAVQQSSAAIAELLDERYRSDKHKLYSDSRNTAHIISQPASQPASHPAAASHSTSLFALLVLPPLLAARC